MNSKNKNIFLFVCIFVVLVIFLDIIFNFSSIFIENFSDAASTSYNTSNTENENNSSGVNSTVDPKSIKSIISKISGRVLNISFFADTNNIISIKSPENPKFNLSINKDGTLSQEVIISDKSSQQYILQKISNATEYRDELKKNANAGLDASSVCTKYPFYIIKSNVADRQTPPWCLAYDSGNIFMHPIGNYNNQKWEVSSIVVSTKSLCTNNMDNTSAGQLRTIPDSSSDKLYNQDKIKVNFNFNDELKSKLFNVDGGEDNNSKCPTYLPKNSINSLCKGCDVNKL
jgi:hypothetical protein